MIPRQNRLAANLFSQEALDHIHRATLEIMTSEGIVFQSPEALVIFQDNGAKVDWSNRRVYFTVKMIEKALISAPSSFVLSARETKYNYPLNDDNSGFTTFGVGFSVIDRKSGVLRDSTKKDLIESAIIGDYLENLSIYSHAVTARDCPLSSKDLHEAEAFLANTSKHCMHLDLSHKSNIRKFIAMAALLTDGVQNLATNPVVSALICPLSPLCFSREGCDIIIEFARVGLPVNILPMAISCQTAPATLSGTLLINNIEFMGGLVLSQLTAPGTPVIYGCSSTSFDFATSTTPVGSPQLGLCSAGAAALARYYCIPSYVAGT